MEVPWLIVLILFISLLNQQELVTATPLDEKLALRNRLDLINKPAIKSFKTEHGDIFDCVEIYKQLAVDHPSMKNHSIQMKPSLHVFSEIEKGSKQKTHPFIKITPSEMVPENMRCPKGTVIVKRVQEEELIIMDKSLSPIIASKYSAPDASKFGQPNKPPIGNHIASVIAHAENDGVSGEINVWPVDAKLGEYSDAYVYVASGDGSAHYVLQGGWAVNTDLFPSNLTRFYASWTVESDGKVTAGCFNTICPGFVQTSSKYPLGFVIPPLSIYDGEQYVIKVSISLDTVSKNWWLIYNEEPIGYWSSELLKTKVGRATTAGWGGQIHSAFSDSAPAMGSGHFPSEGTGKACFIRRLTLFGAQFSFLNFEKYMTKPECYQVDFGRVGLEYGMAFGGPPNCQTT